MLSPLAADHVQRPRNCGPMEGATHFGTCGSRGDGPYVEIWLQIDESEERIKRAAYRTHGCPSSIASASMLCQVVTGRTLSQALSLEAKDLILILGGLPEGKETFATMSVEALRSALASKTNSTDRSQEEP